MERNTTRVSGRSLRICRVASKLLIPGIPISIRTTSGRIWRASITASEALAASPTTSRSDSADRRLRIACRNSVLSSVIRIRVFAILFPTGRVRDAEGDSCSLAGSAPNLQLSAQGNGALHHSGETKGIRAQRARLGPEAGSVVRNAEPDFLIGRKQ